MTKRIKFEGFTPYMSARIKVKGYRPTASSRFAVARVSDRAEAPWELIHIRSGMPVGSLLPVLSRPITMAEKLAVAAAFETLTYCDWTAFDALPELGPNSNARSYLDPNNHGVQSTTAEMRRVAADVFV